MRNEKLTINEVLRNFRSGSPSDMSTETAARKANNVTTGHNATRRVCVCGVTANTAAKKYPSKGGSICDIKVIMSMGNRIDGNKRLLTRTRQGKDVIESSSSTTFIILHGSGWSDQMWPSTCDVVIHSAKTKKYGVHESQCKTQPRHICKTPLVCRCELLMCLARCGVARDSTRWLHRRRKGEPRSVGCVEKTPAVTLGWREGGR